MGSNLVFTLKEIKTTLNGGPTDITYAVDISYNGIPVDYCDENRKDKLCSFDFFKNHVMDQVYNKKTFNSNCETKSQPMKKYFVWLLMIGLICVVVYFAYIDISNEKIKLSKKEIIKELDIEESAVIKEGKNDDNISKDPLAGMGVQVDIDAAKFFDSQNSKSLQENPDILQDK